MRTHLFSVPSAQADISFANSTGQITSYQHKHTGRVDTRPGAAYSKHQMKPDAEDRKILLLELVAASAIFTIVAVVLYMVFSYKPG